MISVAYNLFFSDFQCDHDDICKRIPGLQKVCVNGLCLDEGRMFKSWPYLLTCIEAQVDFL